MTLRTEYLEDVDCGALGMLTLKVEFYYTPEEPSTYEEPGVPEDFDIESVYIVTVVGDIEITSLPTDFDDALVDMLRDIN